jgi:hypothetical protein
MKRAVFKIGLAIPAIVVIVWFTHGHKPQTSGPQEQSVSSNRTSPHVSAASGFLTGFHAIASDTDGVRRDAGLAELAGRWVGKDPGEALDFARQLPAGEVRDTFIRQLLVAWAGENVEAALSWSDQLENESEHKHVRSVICIAFAEISGKCDQALELAIQHGAEEGGDGLLENLAMQWAARETKAPLEWVRQQPAGEWRDRLMARVAFVLAKSDPFNAACHVAEEMEPGPMQHEAVISVLHQWAKTDFAAASDWAGNLPTGPLQERAMNELTGSRSSVQIE